MDTKLYQMNNDEYPVKVLNVLIPGIKKLIELKNEVR